MTPIIAERRHALRDAVPTWNAATLHDRLDQCANRFGGRPFVLTDESTLTYDDVAAESRRLASGLVELGVGPGDRVGMVMANYPEFVTIKFAISRTGAIAVPVNYLYQQDELAYVLADSGCRVVVTMTGFDGLDYQKMLDGIAPEWDSVTFADRPRSAADRVPVLRHVVLLDVDGRARPGVPTVESLSALGSERPAAISGVGVDPHAAADILYTSGTTGTPKGVVTSHDAVLRTAYASALTRAFEDGRRILFSLPSYHMFGYVEGLLSVLYVGGAIIPLTRFSARTVLRRHRTPSCVRHPVRADDGGRHGAERGPDRGTTSPRWTPSCVGRPRRRSGSGLELPRNFGVYEIVTGYGMTECGGVHDPDPTRGSAAPHHRDGGEAQDGGCGVGSGYRRARRVPDRRSADGGRTSPSGKKASWSHPVRR